MYRYVFEMIVLKTVVWVFHCPDHIFQNYSNLILLLLQHKKRNSL